MFYRCPDVLASRSDYATRQVDAQANGLLAAKPSDCKRKKKTRQKETERERRHCGSQRKKRKKERYGTSFINLKAATSDAVYTFTR